MEPIEVALSILSAVALLLLGRYLSLVEKRRDERHQEMVTIQNRQHEQMNKINEALHGEIRTMREDHARDFRVRDEKMADDFRIRDKEIQNLRHQMRTMTANVTMIMAKDHPEIVNYMEKFLKND